MELSSPKLEKFLIFFQKKVCLIFPEWNFLAPTLKNSYIISKKTFFLYFRKELAKPKKQKCLIFLQKISAHILG